jgi:hypothetical protein
MQNFWMKIVTGRIINMLAVLILLLGHVSAANASTFKPTKSDKSLKFYKLDLVDDVNSFLEDEEEEEEEKFSNDHFTLPPVHTIESSKQLTTNTSNLHFSKHKNEKKTSLPLWLEVRHIII